MPYMKKCLIYLNYILFIMGLIQSINAQDPAFSQFYGNPVFLNPALAGNKLCPRITLNYRNQWPSIPASFVTYSVSYDQFVPALNGAVAILVVSDNAGEGILTNNSFSGIYSYRIKLSEFVVMNAALQASYQQLNLDWNKLIFADQLANRTSANQLPPTNEPQPGSLTKVFPDFSAGFIIGYRESIYGGLAVHHLTQPDNGFYANSGSKQLMKVTAHAGAIFNLDPGDKFADIKFIPSFSPNFLYQQQGDFRQMNIGASFNIYPFVAGVWFRYNFDNPDAAIALLGFEHNQFKIGYAYDYTVSKLTNATGGAHEISLAYIFDCYHGSVKSDRIRAIKCPSF